MTKEELLELLAKYLGERAHGDDSYICWNVPDRAILTARFSESSTRVMFRRFGDAPVNGHQNLMLDIHDSSRDGFEFDVHIAIDLFLREQSEHEAERSKFNDFNPLIPVAFDAPAREWKR